MHAGGVGEHHGGAELSGDIEMLEIGEEMTENGRIASEQPEGGGAVISRSRALSSSCGDRRASRR